MYGSLRRVFTSVTGFKPGYSCGIRVAALKTSCSMPSGEKKTHAASVVTCEQLKSMLTNNSVQLIDVRNLDEFQAGRIAGSVNVPLGKLEESLQLPPESFKNQYKVQAPKKEDGNIVFHCRTGRRSLEALEIAWRLGFSRARHYAGGYCEWAEKEKQ